MRRRRRATALLAAAAIVASAAALPAVIRSLDVSREDGRYELVARTHLAAPAEAIFQVLLDYEDDRFSRISSVYKESDYLEPDDDGTPLVYTLMEGCLAFYCRRIRRVERLEARAPHFIRTTTLPEQSGFKYSRSEWQLEAVHDGTEVTYRLVMEPDFWVPPLVGPWLLQRALLRGGTHALERIERLARGVSPEPPVHAAADAGDARVDRRR